MANIRIKSLEMWHFRGEAHSLTTFGEKTTTISGDNGTGKTRTFDAFLWCIFGKDSLDRTDSSAGVFTTKDGQLIDRENAVVEVILDVDGTPIKYHRELHQVWQKPRGEKNEIYKGNETICFINDVPTKVGEYQKKVAEVMNESVFKMVTNPLYFSTIIGWKEQRDMLFTIAGTITDEEIAKDDEDFVALLEHLNGKSLEDYSKEIGASLNRLKPQPKEIDAKIVQTKKMRPEEANWSTIETQLKDIENAIELNEGKLSGMVTKADELDGAMKKYEEAIKKKAELVAESKGFLAKREQELRTKAMDEAAKANLQLHELKSKKSAEESGLRFAQDKIDMMNSQRKDYVSQLETLTKEKDELTANWWTEHDRKFDRTAQVCKTCGQTLPIEQIDDLEAKFNENKKNSLASITILGKKKTEAIETLKTKMNEQLSAITSAENEVKEHKATLHAIIDTLEGMVEVKAQEPDFSADEEWESLKEGVDKMEAMKVNKPSLIEPTKEEEDEKKELIRILKEQRESRDSIKKDLAMKDEIARYDKEINNLEKQLDAVNEEIAALEQQQYIVMQFNKAKADVLQERISNMFTRVKFRLFNFTIEGRASETCEVLPLTPKGFVPFATANNASRINAGLDIINVLCKFFNITAPIFIDNAEGVNELCDTEGQQIHMIVSHDKELVIK